MFKNGISTSLLFLARNLNPRARRRDEEEMEIGYHSFHFHALAILRKHFPDHDLWKKYYREDIFLSYVPDYLSRVMTNIYGIGYNPPGIEIAFALETFEDLFGEIRHKFLGNDFEVSILTEQFLSTLDDKTKMMRNVEFDQDTYAARLYETIRLSEKTLTTLF